MRERDANLHLIGSTPPQPVTRQDAARMMNVSERSVAAGRSVLEKGTPALVEKVERGEVSVSAAADVARLPEPEQREIVAKGEREILEAAKRIRAEKAEQRQLEATEAALHRVRSLFSSSN